jgi:hypothetical protein
MSGRTTLVPFITSAIVTSAIMLWILIWTGRTPRHVIVQETTPREVPFVDFHTDVAHEEDLLPSSVGAAVRWLLRHQEEQGSWSSASFTVACGDRVCTGRGVEAHDLGVTALATLAILESGKAKEQESAIRHAAAWLLARQEENGGFGLQGGKSVYGQAIATLALARAAAVLGDPTLRKAAERGTWALQAAQNPGFAWRYGRRDGQNDTSVTFWAGAALAAASSTDVRIPVAPASLEGIRRWLADVTRDQGEASYMRHGVASSSVRGAGDRYERNEGLTASALWLHLKLGADRRAELLASAAKRLLWSLPTWSDDGRSVDYLAWYTGTLALAEWGRPEAWSIWKDRVLRVLALHQRRYHEGCLAGSWDPDDKWGYEGGRVYATSVNLLTLGVLQRMRAPGGAPSAK